MKNEITKRVHILTNCLQSVLGYIELENPEKALEQLRKCVDQVVDLSHLIRTMKETNGESGESR